MAVSVYERSREHGNEALRRALLDVAGALLDEHGPQALTMRRVASAAGCSTQVLYTTFGGKDGIAEALFREGFRRFAQRLAAVPDEPDPLTRLVALGAAYRENALANRHYYGVMFGQAIPGFVPSEQAHREARATLQVLADQVQACMDAGLFVRADAWAVAEVLWAAAHGPVSLELAGYFDGEYPDREQVARERFETVLGAVGAVFLTTREGDPDDHPAHAVVSTEEGGR